VAQKPYRLQRLLAFINPEREKQGIGYQQYHGILALGSGGVSGAGFSRGAEKYLYLPEGHTDYIFATIGEEMGLAGTLVTLLCYSVVLMRGLEIAHRTRDRFGALVATGVTVVVAGQAAVNIGVVTSSIPATGVPLPLMSYGGSSLIMTLAAIGVLLNISQHPEGAAVRAASAPDAALRRRAA
jgi:cell division protein FtsW